MYMGTYYLPLAGGNFLAGILSGGVYTKISDKYHLLSLEVQKRGLDIPEISDKFSKNEYFSNACEQMSLSHAELTNYLWVNYQPSNIWMLFTGIGLSTVVVLFLYDRVLLKTK
ncbi:MAG: hypothetical protein KAT76_03765 [Bacteroidales bacterium]|nr:hypothetical protein [Bacteroidales bacterium]